MLALFDRVVAVSVRTPLPCTTSAATVVDVFASGNAILIKRKPIGAQRAVFSARRMARWDTESYSGTTVGARVGGLQNTEAAHFMQIIVKVVWNGTSWFACRANAVRLKARS